MNKKPNLFKKATAGNGKKNELHVPSSMNPPKLKVKIWGEENILVKNFHDLSANLKKNKAVITLGFDAGTGKHHSDNLDEVVYRVVNPEPSTEEEWRQMENEALTDFLINKSSELLDKSDDYEKSLKYTLKTEGDKKINLLVEKEDGTDSKLITNVELEGEFYHKETFKAKEVVPIIPPAKPAWWKTTGGKTTILGIIGITLFLIIIFHKKIWKWIKPNKKTPPETITL